MHHANGEDRRRYPRSRRGLRMISDDSSPGVLNHVDNISANGVLCHTVKPIPLMTKMRIHLELPLPDKHRIDTEGIVVRCEPDDQGDDHFEVAILFTKLDSASQQAVQELVAQDLDDDK